MLVSAKITEHLRNEYDLNFTGTWFSGHNISVQGIYYDHSTTTIVSHNLKALIKSPSFTKDVAVNCKLYYDASDLKIGKFIWILNFSS